MPKRVYCLYRVSTMGQVVVDGCLWRRQCGGKEGDMLHMIKAVTLSRDYKMQVEFYISEAQYLSGIEMG